MIAELLLRAVSSVATIVPKISMLFTQELQRRGATATGEITSGVMTLYCRHHACSPLRSAVPEMQLLQRAAFRSGGLPEGDAVQEVESVQTRPRVLRRLRNGGVRGGWHVSMAHTAPGRNTGSQRFNRWGVPHQVCLQRGHVPLLLSERRAHNHLEDEVVGEDLLGHAEAVLRSLVVLLTRLRSGGAKHHEAA